MNTYIPEPRDATIAKTGKANTFTANQLITGTLGVSGLITASATALGAVQSATVGNALVNTTLATSLAPVQISPAIRWSGSGWKTDATAASQTVEFRSYVVPAQGTANPTGLLTFDSSVNGGVYGGALTLSSAGHIGVTGNIRAAGTANSFGSSSNGGAVVEVYGLTGIITPLRVYVNGVEKFTVADSGNVISTGNITASGTGTFQSTGAHTFGTTNTVTMTDGSLVATLNITAASLNSPEIKYDLSYNYYLLNASGIRLWSSGAFNFYPGISLLTTPDLGIARNANGILEINNGIAGTFRDLKLQNLTATGNLTAKTLVEANTAVAAAPNLLTAVESRSLMTNEGAVAENVHTLALAEAGLDFEFVCQDIDGIKVIANTADTIRDVGTVSAAAGYIRSSVIGSVIRLKAINATQWFVVYKQGTWTIDI